jgi:hypothetical protein
MMHPIRAAIAIARILFSHPLSPQRGERVRVRGEKNFGNKDIRPVLISRAPVPEGYVVAPR